MGGVAQLAFEFQYDVLLRDVERKSFARDSRGAQGDGDRLQDGGREVKVGLHRFDLAGGEVGVGAGLGRMGMRYLFDWRIVVSLFQC